MNEAVGARVMKDSSGHGLHGKVGLAVQTGMPTESGGTGYRWVATTQAEPYSTERIVQVPDDDRLDAGQAAYAVSFRFRTVHLATNMIQKGQSGGAGGYWKVEVHSGRLSCLFEGIGSGGKRLRRAVDSPALVTDGLWHTARCARSASGVSLSLDGKVVRRASGSTGRVANGVPLTLGGKRACNQYEVGCDYYLGDMDWVRVHKG